mgnify:CR=1 FL=1
MLDALGEEAVGVGLAFESADQDPVSLRGCGLSLADDQVSEPRGDDSGRHCLASPDCCARIGEVTRDCYRAQCFATARALAAAPATWARLGVLCPEDVIAAQETEIAQMKAWLTERGY